MTRGLGWGGGLAGWQTGGEAARLCSVSHLPLVPQDFGFWFSWGFHGLKCVYAKMCTRPFKLSMTASHNHL